MQSNILTVIRLRCRAAASIVSGVLLGSLMGADPGGKFVPNQDESKVPAYRLPDPLVPAGGPTIADRASWESAGRPHTLELFESHVYGRVPADFQPTLEWKLDKQDDSALDGTAIRREYLITIGESVPVRMLLYLPKDAPGPVACFLGLNFRGNQRVEADPAITMETGYVIGRSPEVEDNRPSEASRGTGTERWPAKLIVGRGYALATACCGNFDPDFDDGFRNGVHALDSAPRSDESWATISAWSWGLSRLLDVLKEVEELDGARVAVVGHSRLGKTALWAGARDPRFAMVISNNSGCGGAALSRRAFGETVGRINSSFPHWFAGAFKRYNQNESALPVDQHQLIGLIAPRPIYVASATGDLWADPKGEFLALRHAEAIYRLYQDDPFGGVTSPPPPGRHVGHLMGYHLRQGPHAITPEDWKHYLNFADQWLGKTSNNPLPEELPLGLCLVHEMGYIPELDSWKSAEIEEAGAHALGVTKAWKELVPSLEKVITAKLAQRLSQWATKQMETYTQVPSIEGIVWKPVRSHSGGKILFEGTVDTLPSHSPIVTRWFRVYLLYDSTRESILRTTVTIRGQALE